MTITSNGASSQPPFPTVSTCASLADAMNTQFSFYPVNYSCSSVGGNKTVKSAFVKVCSPCTASISSSIVASMTDMTAQSIISSLPGYESVTCNVALSVSDSCSSPPYEFIGMACQDPSPPPPPFMDSPFPFCSCTLRSALLSPYSLIPTPSDPSSLCVRISSGICSLVGSPCCGMDISKIEFLISSACWGAVSTVTVVSGGNRTTQRSVSYARASSGGSQYTTMVLSGLKIPSPSATPSASEGLRVCFQLRGTPQCPTVTSLCNTPIPGYAPSQPVCAYSLFNSGLNCCPTSAFNI